MTTFAVTSVSSLFCQSSTCFRIGSKLHSVNANGDAVDHRERLLVFREHRREVSCKRHVRAHEYSIATGHRQTHALVMRVARPNREAATLHLGFEIQNAEQFHAIRRHSLLVVDDPNVAEPERFNEGPLDSRSVELAGEFRSLAVWAPVPVPRGRSSGCHSQ